MIRNYIFLAIVASICCVAFSKASTFSLEIESLGLAKATDKVAQGEVRHVVKLLQSLESSLMVQRVEKVVAVFTVHSDAYVIMRRFDDTRRTYCLQMFAWENGVMSLVDVKAFAVLEANISVRLFDDKGGNVQRSLFDAINASSAVTNLSMRPRLYDGNYVVISYGGTKIEKSGCKAVYGPDFVSKEKDEPIEDGFRQLSELEKNLAMAFGESWKWEIERKKAQIGTTKP